MRDLGALDQLKCKVLIVEDDGEDGTRRGPGAAHQVVEGHCDYRLDCRLQMMSAGCDGSVWEDETEQHQGRSAEAISRSYDVRSWC